MRWRLLKNHIKPRIDSALLGEIYLFFKKPPNFFSEYLAMPKTINVFKNCLCLPITSKHEVFTGLYCRTVGL